MSDGLKSLAPEEGVALYFDARKGEIATETEKSHRYRLKQFLQWCREEGIEDLNELDARDLHRFRLARREDDLEEITLRGQLSTLRAFLHIMEDMDAVEPGLAETVRLPSLSYDESVSDSTLEAERVEKILAYVSRYHYASRYHVTLLLLWNTGIRTGALRAIDLDDCELESDEPGIHLQHRPSTALKNQGKSQRWLALRESTADVVSDYIDGPRIDKVDEAGRRPLLTTRQGRVHRGTIRNWMYLMTRPCWIGEECPHDRDPETCEATDKSQMSKCPSARSPHDARSGAITDHLTGDVPPQVVSDRMDVSEDVLEQHYDKRSEREKMNQRREYLSE
jgi:site-specific recombinase XerD